MFSGWKGGGASGFMYGASGGFMKGSGGFMYMKGSEGSEGSEGKDIPLKAGVLSCAEIPRGGLGGCLSPFPFPLGGPFGGMTFMVYRGVSTPPQFQGAVDIFRLYSD